MFEPTAYEKKARKKALLLTILIHILLFIFFIADKPAGIFDFVQTKFFKKEIPDGTNEIQEEVAGDPIPKV